VTIVRDGNFGVPHIYGKTRAGTMFGLGYVGAEDRLFTMDALRHAGRGELSTFAAGAAGNRAQDHTQWELAPYTEADLQRQYDLGEEVYGAAVFYKDEICEDYEMPSDQWCYDTVRQRPVGAINQPLIHWINRPTFQQVIEIKSAPR
jgi:hypothetical protein